MVIAIWLSSPRSSAQSKGKRMKLKYLDIRRMPGFLHQGLRYKQEDLAKSNLHVVIGANGVGKTTTCKAIRALLWPSLSHLEPTSLHSIWITEGEKIELSLEGKHWKCTPANPELQKQLPPPSYASCYTLTIEDLLSSASDQDFAAEIAKQARGGYDLSHVRNHPFFTIGRFKGKSDKQDLDLALKNLRLAKEQQRSLKQDEESLFTIEKEIEAASHSQSLLPLLEDALRWKELDEGMQALSMQIRGYPAQLEKFRENDQEIYQQLRMQKQEYGLRLNKIEKEMTKEQEVLKGLPFSHLSLPSPQTLENIQALLDQLKEVQDDKNHVKQALTQANQSLSKYRAFIHLSHTDTFTLEELSRAQQWTQDYEVLKQKREIIQTRIHILENSSTVIYPPETLREGTALLNLWKATRTYSPNQHWVACLFTLLLSLFFLIIPSLSNFPWEWALMGSSCGLMTLFLWLWNHPYDIVKQAKEKVQNQYKALQLPLPHAWSDEDVAHTLNAIESHWGQALRHQEDTGLRQELSFHAESLEKQWDHLCAALELYPMEQERISYPILYDSIKNVILLQTSIENHEQKLALHVDEEKTILKKLCAFFHVFTEQELTHHARAWQLFLDVCHQFEQIRTCQSHLSHLQEQFDHLKQDLNVLQENIDALYKRCECTSEEILLECLHLFSAYHQLRQTYQHKQIEAEVLKQRLAQHPNLLNLSHVELQNLKNTSLLMAKGIERWMEKKTAIKQALQFAENAYQLEDAHTQVLEKQAKFERVFEEFGLAIAGQTLLDKIEKDYQRESQPEVFSIANEWFSRFTKAHFSLIIPEQTTNGFEFLAYDTKSCEIKKLHELSRGTQSQLILAVRLAFNLFIEKEKKPLPFFLDETLSGSDTERFYEIARSLCEIAATGRQIFYFTCREADMHAWEQIVKDHKGLTFNRIDLSSMQPLEKIVPSMIPMQTRQPLPEETLVDYAAFFTIPQIIPHLGKGHVHVYHLLEEAEELYYLQHLHIQTYGQLKQQMELGKIQRSFGNEKTWKKIASKGLILEQFFACWNVGRGKAIDAEILTRCGVSDKYLEPILAIADQTHYNSSKLLEILAAKQDERLKGFRLQTLSRLKEVLIEEGYVDTREPLSLESFQIELLQIAGPSIQAGILTPQETIQFINQLGDRIKAYTNFLQSD
ncbi:hypothetical protein DB43_FU00100 [Parachlamydia acanthamoebae]|nr:hypothetical protein DB43_FU00100 [Parachlamydia acanthamoebae]